MKFNNRNDISYVQSHFILTYLISKYITTFSRMIQPTEDGVKGNTHLLQYKAPQSVA